MPLPRQSCPPHFEVSCVCYQVNLESPQSPCLVSMRFLLGYLDGLGLMCLISKPLKEPMFSAADFLQKPESILNNVKDLAFGHRKWSFLVNVLGPPTKARQFSGAGWETHHSLSLFSLPSLWIHPTEMLLIFQLWRHSGLFSCLSH